MENNFFTGKPPCPLRAADGIVLLFLLPGFFRWIFGFSVTTKYNSLISQNQDRIFLYEMGKEMQG